MGTLIAFNYLLTLESPHRFRKIPNVGCYLGLQPEMTKTLGGANRSCTLAKVAIHICERCW